MKTVLVVEDGRAEQQLIGSLLAQAGCDVVVFSSAEAAWQWLESHIPNLIILDIIMPGQSGLDLCRLIRATDKLQAVPIVFCTSKNQEFDRFWALRQGGNAYITKPFAPKELLEAVYPYLK